MAGDPLADDYLARLTAGLPSKYSSKRRSGRDTGRSAKFPALNRFDQPIQAAPQNRRMQQMTAPSGYDLTAGRLPLPIPGTGAVLLLVLLLHWYCRCSTGTVIASGTATGTSGTQFSAEDNLLAIQKCRRNKILIPRLDIAGCIGVCAIRLLCGSRPRCTEFSALIWRSYSALTCLSRITRNGGPPILVSNYFSAFQFCIPERFETGTTLDWN